MFSGSQNMILGGTFINQNHTSRGMDLLLEWVATGALHNSDELHDALKCHPRTRVAVLNNIMKWVGESESAREDLMLWLFGAAGAGKSAIAKKIAEIAADMGMLIGTFFFSRTSPNRSNKDRVVATLAYQLALSLPDTRSCIENAIEQDPTIFRKNVQTQIDTLLIKPFLSASPTEIVPSKKLIIIDGLDECNDSQAQVTILEATSRSFTQHNLPIKCLVVSRPEPDIDTSFNCHEPLRFIHRRLALDDTYRPDDIHLFFSDKFEQIKHTHRLRSTIPTSWPTKETLETLVAKSSGQFIYASTVVKFVESSRHQPTARLNIVLGISPPGRTNPFTELDALYNHLLSSVDDIQLTLCVLGFYVMTPGFAYNFHTSLYINSKNVPPEIFLSLEPGDIQLALISLSSILTYDESSGAVKVLHASLVDFLSDKRRSTTFYIGMSNTCADFVRRILQYVKEPDGIQAGYIYLFRVVNDLHPWIPGRQLWTDVLDFDVDTLVNALIKSHYNKTSPFVVLGSPIEIFSIWKRFLVDAGLQDSQALDRLKESFESRLKIYQFDRRLQLLLTLTAAHVMYLGGSPLPYCRFVDILLEMDNHDLHIADHNALDLRHTYRRHRSILVGTISPYVDGDTYASAALHCMRFLSNPPTFSKGNPKIGLIHAEWKEMCAMTLKMLYKLLKQANTSPELVQFISDHDIHPSSSRVLPHQISMEA